MYYFMDVVHNIVLDNFISISLFAAKGISMTLAEYCCIVRQFNMKMEVVL